MVFFAPVFFFFIPAGASHFVIPAKAGIQFLSFIIPAKASHFVIPAKAGIQFFSFLFFFLFVSTKAFPDFRC